MSYAKLNIWLRDLKCCPKNEWKVDLVVKTCCGDYLVDFNPDVIDKLKKAYPGYHISRNIMDSETTILIHSPQWANVIKHIEVEVPPGCYIVRAWVCSDNLWTDRAMVIVGCGQEACVNLIVPIKEHCIRNAFIAFGDRALGMKLPPDKVQVAIDMLMKAGQMKKEDLYKELTALTKALSESKAESALKLLESVKFIDQLVHNIK